MESTNYRNTIGVFKDQTSITLAKVASFSNLRVVIVKATGHKACPMKEHHIREILTLTSYSRYHAASCVATISQRLSKTKDWVVAIKALILIQHLMQEGSPVFLQELFFTTDYNGTHILDMSNFQDTAWANSWDFSKLVRAYALYLHEQLNSRVQECGGRYGVFSYTEDEDEHLSPGAIVVRTTLVQEVQNKQIYIRVQRLMKQLDSFLAIRPTGAAKDNKLIAQALHPLVEQSIQLYYEIAEIVAILLDIFDELDVADSMKAFNIFCQVTKQYEELEIFYHWCNDACIVRTSDYVKIKKISQTKLDEMDEFIIQKTIIKQQELIHEPMLQLELKREPEPKCEPEPQATQHLVSVEPHPTIEGVNEETKTQDIGDLLCLEYDAPTTHQNSDQLALALFGNGFEVEASEKTKTQPWDALIESSDWETALVQTASQLSKQQPCLPSGFDTQLLDGMYEQGATQAVVNSGMMTVGSASSVAIGSTRMSAPLALAPPSSANGTSPGEDPFASSYAVPPPSYVQMSDIEKKQRLLVEEQIMWQQYQGQVGMDNMHMNQPVYTI